MKLLSHIIAVLLLSVVVASQAAAQTTYRCGNSYSQQPCPGGSAVDASDSRTPEQRKAHELSTKNEKRAADTLEKNRLKDEAGATRAAEQADKSQRAAEKAAQKPAPAKPKSQRAKDKIPAYRAPVAAKQK
jgi:hypothetical protein